MYVDRFSADVSAFVIYTTLSVLTALEKAMLEVMTVSIQR
jgi:hypothetical protein